MHGLAPAGRASRSRRIAVSEVDAASPAAARALHGHP